jgi:hypothetical protein
MTTFCYILIIIGSWTLSRIFIKIVEVLDRAQ